MKKLTKEDIFFIAEIIFCIFLLWVFSPLGIIFWLTRAVQLPEAGKGMIIMKLKGFHDCIINSEEFYVNAGLNYDKNAKHEKKVMNDNGTCSREEIPAEKWDILRKPKMDWTNTADEWVDKRDWLARHNINIYPWPFCWRYKREFSYLKMKRKSELKDSDTVLYNDEKAGLYVVSRTNISNFFYIKTTYPRLTANLLTSENAAIIALTDNSIRTKNPPKTYFNASDCLEMSESHIDGVVRTIVSKNTLDNLKAGSESKGSYFTKDMLYINYCGNDPSDGIAELYGYELEDSVYKGYIPATPEVQALINSYTKKQLAENLGKEKLAKAEYDKKAFDEETAGIVKRKKDSGLLHTNDKNEVEQLPDPNTVVISDAVAALGNVKTLVMGTAWPGSGKVEIPAEKVRPILDIDEKDGKDDKKDKKGKDDKTPPDDTSDDEKGKLTAAKKTASISH